MKVVYDMKALWCWRSLDSAELLIALNGSCKRFCSVSTSLTSAWEVFLTKCTILHFTYWLTYLVLTYFILIVLICCIVNKASAAGEECWDVLADKREVTSRLGRQRANTSSAWTGRLTAEIQQQRPDWKAEGWKRWGWWKRELFFSHILQPVCSVSCKWFMSMFIV